MARKFPNAITPEAQPSARTAVGATHGAASAGCHVITVLVHSAWTRLLGRNSSRSLLRVASPVDKLRPPSHAGVGSSSAIG